MQIGRRGGILGGSAHAASPAPVVGIRSMALLVGPARVDRQRFRAIEVDERNSELKDQTAIGHGSSSAFGFNSSVTPAWSAQGNKAMARLSGATRSSPAGPKGIRPALVAGARGGRRARDDRRGHRRWQGKIRRGNRRETLGANRSSLRAPSPDRSVTRTAVTNRPCGDEPWESVFGKIDVLVNKSPPSSAPRPHPAPCFPPQYLSC